jgi:hypothetical protein
MLKLTRNRFYVVPVLMRTLDILEFLRASNAPLKTNEISHATLVHRGYLVQDLEGRFSILNRPEPHAHSPRRPALGKPLRSQQAGLSGDQVIQILDSVLQTLKHGNDASLDLKMPGKPPSPPARNLNRTHSTVF